MEKNLVIYIFLVILFSKDGYACFHENVVSERIISTFSTFYEECCCTDPGHTNKELMWIDSNNKVIGPGMHSNMYIEEQGDCLALHIPSSSKTLSGTYSCVTIYNGVNYVQKYNLGIYDPLYFYNTTALQYLVYGTDSMIRCEAKGFSPPRFQWTRGQEGHDEIKDSEKYQIRPDGLIIKNVTNEDAGIYKCSASVMSTGEELEIDIEVQVMTKPVIKSLTASPEKIAIAGESLIIECIAEGLPKPQYSWKKLPDMKAVEVKQNETNITWVEDNNSIRFIAIEPKDAGIYECTAQNFVGTTIEFIEIKVLVPPTIIDFTNRTAEDGTEIPILCNVTGNPTPNVTITYEGKSFEEEKSLIFEQYINNYSLLKVDKSKEGIYICNATNEVSYETEYMYLTVVYKPEFSEPRQTMWGWNGETIDLKCDPDANPPANITWRYYKDVIATTNEADINEILANKVNGSHNFTIRITEDFAPFGLYECVARNKIGEGILRIDLLKGYLPPHQIVANVKEVTATSATFILENHFKTLPPTGPPILGYIGEYDIAENYNITHIHRNRTWAITRPFKLDNLKPNSTYFVKFAAINRVGTGDWSEMIEFETLEKSAPESPIWQVDPLQFSPSDVLKWKEPQDNGEPIDYYALRYCLILYDIEIDSVCKELRIWAATEKQLDDLQPNTTYNFELIAHNSEGNSTAANITLTILPVAVESLESEPLLSGGVIIGISVIIVVLCLILLDLLLFFWRRQGIIASCCYKKNKKKPSPLTNSRDKKGLLKDNGESTDESLRRPNNGHKEYEYNKTTGIITGKHSSV